ncbi:MAG: hypothetical protein Q9225_000201 [Loekoesia sp. 1 TL-2023]
MTDRSISYPLEPETITTTTLVLAALIAPAGIIFIGSLFIGAGPGRQTSSRYASLRRKLWEWNTGWMGLALSFAVAFVITNGAKEVLGKPRPDLLARCNPDLSRRVNAVAGGIGEQIEEVAFAGLVYLALWMCAKLGISIPFLSPRKLSSAVKEQDDAALFRTQAAAPPTYLIIFPLVPIGAAIYISSTRYSDFWHHGFDVFTSSILGTVTAWLGFRWYHMPIRRGGGWAWAPRSSKRAYWKSMGILTYVDNNDEPRRAKDLESGGIVGSQFPPPPGSGNVRNSNRGVSGESYEMGDFIVAQEPRDFTAHGRGERTQQPLR